MLCYAPVTSHTAWVPGPRGRRIYTSRASDEAWELGTPDLKKRRGGKAGVHVSIDQRMAGIRKLYTHAPSTLTKQGG